MTKKFKFKSFEDARILARSLNFKNQSEWRKWAKINERPRDIPAYPDEVYLNKGWNGWGDFLGTGAIATHKRKFRPFDEAKKFARSLNLKKKSKSGWFEFLESNELPKDIPVSPAITYKKEWKGWGDFLGTGKIAPKNYKYMSFEEAKKFIRTFGFKTGQEFREWTKTGARPKDFPVAPWRAYREEGWNGLGNFLGLENIANQNRTFMSFEEAKKFIRSLGFKNRKEFCEWAKTNKRPKDIPSNPEEHYKKDWTNWGDFLGTGTIAPQNKKFRSFGLARDFARTLKLNSKEEWFKFVRTKEKPNDIPSDPPKVYKDKWRGWNDFLGCNNGWGVENIRCFVSSILPYLDTFNPAELYVLFQQSGILDIDRSSKGRSFIQALKTGKFPREELEKFIKKEPSLVDNFFEDPEFSLEDDIYEISEKDIVLERDDLPVVETKDILTSVDSKQISSMDSEAADFFIKSAVAKIWQHVYLDEANALKQLNQYNKGGMYAEEVKNLFLFDYNASKKLIVPKGYSFYKDGELCLPNLMQRYTAYLIKSRKRIGNWSGTGAGKTLSAILASRVIDAKFTIICCPNSIVDGWEEDIKEIYPDSIVVTKDLEINFNKNQHNYLILNYEFFQQPQSERKLKLLLNDIGVDFIVIDEIHYSKQRDEKKISKRKQIIAAMLSEAALVNENLHVLGMSATPVINNLFEGKTLIELITGVHHNDLNKSPRVENCIALYQKLVSNGIRFVPKYSQKLDVRTIEVDGSSFLEEIKKSILLNGLLIGLEASLTKVKIPTILANLKPRTIVYTHYIQNILDPLKEAIEKAEWKTAVYSGDNKTGLEEFLSGDADVLIATSCVGTGVDGLQDVCNRIIVNSLPWTHAEFEQLKGRIYRQGQKKESVDIIVPLTYAIINGGRWSWCDSRWKRIQFKKSIADAAVDGIIPEGHLRTPGQAYQDHVKWLERLDGGIVHEVERLKIDLRLSDEQQKIGLRRFGDFSQMNQRINSSLSTSTNQRFLKNPEEWELYHSLYREKRKDWPVIPYQEAITWCKKRPHLIVGDFGCGEACLAKELENQVYSFDHVAINDNVIACDMAHVPLEDEFLDAAIFSLSLMGINYLDYIKEAHRCLKLDGDLWIAESTSRFKNLDSFQDKLIQMGFDIVKIYEKGDFTFLRAIKSDRW